MPDTPRTPVLVFFFQFSHAPVECRPVSLSTLFSVCPISPLSFPVLYPILLSPSHPLPFSSHPLPTHSPCPPPLPLSFPPVAQLHSALEEDGLHRRARFHHGHLLGGSRRAVQGHAGRQLHGHLVRVSEIFFMGFKDFFRFFLVVGEILDFLCVLDDLFLLSSAVSCTATSYVFPRFFSWVSKIFFRHLKFIFFNSPSLR